MHVGLIAALVVTALPGCVYNHEHERYLRRSDSITIGAGNASAFNSAVHTVDPWPWYSQNANINVDGKRALIVTRRHQYDDVKPPLDPSDLYQTEVEPRFKGPLSPDTADPYSSEDAEKGAEREKASAKGAKGGKASAGTP